MGKTIVAKPNQSMLDIIIQAMGSLEAGMAFCAVNNVAISDTPAVGYAYEVPDSGSVQALIDTGVLKYIGQNALVIGTLGTAPPPPPPLSMTVVLKPVMAVSYMGAIPPSALGYYPIAMNATTDFINTNPLQITYPADNKLNHEDTGAMLLGALPFTTPELGGIPMTGKHVEYRIPWTGPLGDIWVWNPYLALETVSFADTLGNVACAAPVIVLYDHTAGINESLIAELVVDFVSSDGYTATLRLTRSHPPTVNINLTPPYGHMNMYWTPVSSPMYEDPAHVGNPDIRLIDLPPGNHTLGVWTEYVNDVVPFTWPAHSTCKQVVSIY